MTQLRNLKTNFIFALDPVEFAFSFIYANKEFFAAPYTKNSVQFQIWANKIARPDKQDSTSTKKSPHQHLLLRLSNTLKRAIQNEYQWKAILIGLPGDPNSDHLFKSRDSSNQLHELLHENTALVAAIHTIALAHYPMTTTHTDAKIVNLKPLPLHDKLIKLTNPIITLWYQNHNMITQRNAQVANEVARLKEQYDKSIQQKIIKRRIKKYGQLLESIYTNIEYFLLLFQKEKPRPPMLNDLHTMLVTKYQHNANDTENTFVQLQNALMVFADSIKLNDIRNTKSTDLENLLQEVPELLDILYPSTLYKVEINDWYEKSAPTPVNNARTSRAVALQQLHDNDSDNDVDLNDDKAPPATTSTAANDKPDLKFTPMTPPKRNDLKTHDAKRSHVVINRMMGKTLGNSADANNTTAAAKKKQTDAKADTKKDGTPINMNELTFEELAKKLEASNSHLMADMHFLFRDPFENSKEDSKDNDFDSLTEYLPADITRPSDTPQASPG